MSFEGGRLHFAHLTFPVLEAEVVEVVEAVVEVVVEVMVEVVVMEVVVVEVVLVPSLSLL